MTRRFERRKARGSAYRRNLAEERDHQIYFELLMSKDEKNTLKNSKTIERERGTFEKGDSVTEECQTTSSDR